MIDEPAARQWLTADLDVSRETFDRLDSFVGLLRSENRRQNLVSAKSLEYVWVRHIADSAQLLRHAPEAGNWLDLGTGAGFPGLVVALLRREGKTVLVEERRKRGEFLEQAAALLGLGEQVEIVTAPIERLPVRSFHVISARAFAPLGRLLALAERFATPETRWVLPKGRNAKTELEAAESSWQGVFRLEPSLTDPDASIIVAEQVRRRGKGMDPG